MIDYKIYKVLNPNVTKRLLKKGYKIKDIEPNKNNHNKTVFVFYVEGDFLEDVIKFKEEIKAERMIDNPKIKM